MSEDLKAVQDRRRFLKIAGGAAIIAPLVGLAACSGEKQEASAPAAAKPRTDNATPAPAKEMPAAVKEAPAAAAGNMPKLAEDDPQAKSLSYVHEATTVDSAKQPRYQSGQICGNCALYQGKAPDEWGGCSIFPGKLVKSSGWCSVYAPKPA